MEYLYLGIFIVGFAIILTIVDSITKESFKIYTTIAFVLGACTSILSGYIGMYVATRTNVRVTYQASSAIRNNNDHALQDAFIVAFRGGCVMGFCLVSLALGVLTVLLLVYKGKYLYLII